MWPWVVRLVWVGLPLAAGPALAAALDPRSAPVQAVASTGLWVAWAAVLLTTVVPRPEGLAAARVGSAGAVAAVLGAAASGEASALASGVGVLAAGAVTAVLLAPETGSWFVNGAAYGDERRFLLRPPGSTVLVLAPLTVLAVLAGVATGPLLLATGEVLTGGLALVAGLVVAGVGVRALHALCLRWMVLVPAGLVLKDHLALVDPVLFRRRDIAGLGPAPADTDALDLTFGALGLAVELRLTEPVPLVRARSTDQRGQPAHALLCTPTRPGRLLTAAADRRIRLG